MKKLVAVIAVVMAFPVLAQTERVVQEPDKEVTAKETNVDFTAVPITGDGAKPSLTMVPARPSSDFGNRILIRANFNPELQKSVESL